MNWICVKDALPPEGIYVLVHLVKNNWRDRTDPTGVYHHVAKMRCGISKDDRDKINSARSRTYKGEDEYGNNLVPYKWETFGPSSFFGQEVDRWMYIPAHIV